jgi:hypothetical protein
MINFGSDAKDSRGGFSVEAALGSLPKVHCFASCKTTLEQENSLSPREFLGALRVSAVKIR